MGRPAHGPVTGLSAGCSSLVRVRPLIESGHYLGKVHNRGRCAIELLRGDEVVGAALFGQPARETVAVSLWKCDDDEDRKSAVAATLELTRFYTIDGLHPNAGTWFLSRAVRMLPSGTEMLIAFSDEDAGHHGGLYQAASWLYTGTSASDHYHYVDGQGGRVAKQTPWRYAQRQRLADPSITERPADGERRIAAERGWTKVKDKPKHRYVLPLTRKARASLKLKVLEYPKPSRAG